MVVDANIVFKAAQSGIREIVSVENAIKNEVGFEYTSH